MSTQQARENWQGGDLNPWREHGPKAARGGWRTILIESGQKGPRLKGWPDRGAPLDAEVVAWAARPAANMGLNLGWHPLLPVDEHVTAIDLDFLNRAARRAVLAIVRRRAPGAPLRRGSIAKVGAFFVRVRVEEGETIALPQGGKFAFIDTPEGKNEMVEVLGAGKQAVIHGIHPSGVPYEWEGGRSILDMQVSDLPCLTVAQVGELVAEIDAAATAAGGILKQSGYIVVEQRQRVGEADLMPLNRELSEELVGRVRVAPNEMTREEWVMNSKAVWRLTKDALGEEVVREALEDFHARYEGFTGDHEPLHRVLNELEPPTHYGLRQVVRSLEAGDGWSASPEMLRRMRWGDAKLDFEGVPFSIADMLGSTDEQPWHVNDNGEPGAGGRVPRAPKVAAADMSENADALAAMNRRYAVVRMGGSTAVLRFGAPGTVPALMSKSAFLDLEAHNKITGPGGRRVPVAPIWFGWSGRRTYDEGVALYPQGIGGHGAAVPPGAFNTWQGFVSDPAPAGVDWPTIREYIHEVLCAGDERLSAWVTNWFAQAVQYPHEKPGTALILKGAQGSGKTTLTNLLRAIFHATHVISADRPEALLGKHNAHLRDAVFVVADEAVFAGDPAANNRLKAFVTDPMVTVEPKGIDSVSVPSFHRLVMTTNEDHVIRAETDARRWVLLEVSDAKVGDAAYFNTLYAVLKPSHPEVRAFLRDLAAMPVDHDAVRRAPTTVGLIGQVIQSLPAPLQWLYEMLRDALPAEKLLTPQSAAATVPYESDFGRGPGEWPAYATREALTQSFDRWAAGRRYLRGNSINALGNALKLFGPAMQVKGADGVRRRVVRLGTLAEARAAFAGAHLRGVNDVSVWGAEDEQVGD